jgi:hypothetical protein
VNAYLYSIREHASQETLDQIEEALQPAVTDKVGGEPAWYGSDDDAWAEFARQVTDR